MFKNVASQKITFLVIDTANNVPKTGDSANLTAYVSKDDAAVTVLGDTSATELDATNAPGLYSFDLTQAETNADKLLFSGKSSTSGIRVVPLLLYTAPSGFGDLTIANNATAANVTRFGGTAGTFSGGRPEVNTTHAAGTAWGSGAITAASIANDAITDAKVASDVTIASVTGAVGSVTGSVGSVAGAVGSVTGNVGGNVTGNVTGNVGGNVLGSVGSLGTQAKLDVNAEVDSAILDVGLTTTITGRIDAAVTTRMATYTQPAGFLAATFPATVASTTNITAGTITTVTNLTTVSTGGITAGSFSAGAIDAAAIAANAIDADALAADAIAEINATVDTALADYGGPTNAQMELRTLAAAEYATAAEQTTQAGYLVAINGKTTNLPAAPAAVEDIPTTAEINAQVLDVLTVDTFAEPAGVPAATASLADKIGWNTALARNKVLQTSTTQTLRNDADSANIATANHADDGSVHTRSEWT